MRVFSIMQEAMKNEGAKKKRKRENTLNFVSIYCVILANHLRRSANPNTLLCCQELSNM